MLDRRAFVKAASALALGAAGGTTLVPHATAEAIEPIRRNGQPKFKFSLAAYSYRSLLQGSRGQSPTLTLREFVDDCAALGLEGTELTSYYFPSPVTPEYLHGLRQHCFRLGLDVSGTAVGNDFGHPPGERRDAQIALVKQWVDHAVALGAPVIRIFAGHVPQGQSAEETHKRMVAAIEECCDYAGQRGIHLALENHGGPTATAEGLLRFVRDVQSPWFGVNLDSGNFSSADPYAELEQIAPYAINVQVKVVVRGPDGKKVPADFRRLAAILRQVGYRGYIVLEYEEAGDVRQECARYLRQIREAFA
jgi:sugar phosphate isomerase/epimerase